MSEYVDEGLLHEICGKEQIANEVGGHNAEEEEEENLSMARDAASDKGLHGDNHPAGKNSQKSARY